MKKIIVIIIYTIMLMAIVSILSFATGDEVILPTVNVGMNTPVLLYNITVTEEDLDETNYYITDITSNEKIGKEYIYVETNCTNFYLESWISCSGGVSDSFMGVGTEGDEWVRVIELDFGCYYQITADSTGYVKIYGSEYKSYQEGFTEGQIEGYNNCKEEVENEYIELTNLTVPSNTVEEIMTGIYDVAYDKGVTDGYNAGEASGYSEGYQNYKNKNSDKNIVSGDNLEEYTSIISIVAGLSLIVFLISLIRRRR